jgi:hypothetical protein
MKKTAIKLSLLLALSGLFLKPASAQTKAEVFDKKTPITWLGMDFSQMKFIGSEDAYRNEVINAEFVGKYIPLWENFFLKEPKKYNPAKAAHRDTVHFAMNVTEKVNNALTKNFFDTNPGHFKTLTEKDIDALVKNYDFLGNKGIGMLLIVEGMDKGQKSAGAWVTFVNMNDKTVLYTVFRTGKSFGFGFKNYWAHPWSVILNDFAADFDLFKKY